MACQAIMFYDNFISERSRPLRSNCYRLDESSSTRGIEKTPAGFHHSHIPPQCTHTSLFLSSSHAYPLSLPTRTSRFSSLPFSSAAPPLWCSLQGLEYTQGLGLNPKPLVLSSRQGACPLARVTVTLFDKQSDRDSS